MKLMSIHESTKETDRRITELNIQDNITEDKPNIYCCNAPILTDKNTDSYKNFLHHTGHLFRFIKRGSRIIKSTIIPSTGSKKTGDHREYLTATSQDDSIVLILINRACSDMLFTTNFKNMRETYCCIHKTDIVFYSRTYVR